MEIQQHATEQLIDRNYRETTTFRQIYGEIINDKELRIYMEKGQCLQ